MKIAAQMFTLREFCKDERGVVDSFKKVKAMGYDGVQLSGVSAPLSPAEMKAILDGEGLVPVVTHRGLDVMKNDLQSLIDEHKTLGCKYMAIGGLFPSKEDWTVDYWLKFIDEYNAIAEKLSGTGITLGYHNHSHEFATLNGTQRPIDLLLARLDSRVWIEIDTYWVAHAGANPSEYIRKVAGRIPVIHFKDMAITMDRVQKMTEIGYGNLNWFDILDACRYAGVKWFAVERDAGDTEPFESLRRSIVYMRETLGM